MTSGRKLTQEQIDAILQLAGELLSDGRYQLSYRQIGDKLDLHRRTVSRVIRSSAVKYGKLHAWSATDFGNDC